MYEVFNIEKIKFNIDCMIKFGYIFMFGVYIS